MQRTAVSLPQKEDLPPLLFIFLLLDSLPLLDTRIPRGINPTCMQVWHKTQRAEMPLLYPNPLPRGVPAVHRRCCPWCSVPCPACPWGISGGPGGRRAARGSRGPAAAPPAAPAAACRGCSLRRAGASSSPSDPSGSRAARQQETRQAHQCIAHLNIPAPRKARQRTAPRRSSPASSRVLTPKLHQNYSSIPAALPKPPRHQEQAQREVT